MRTRAWLVVAVALAVALAGCTGGPGGNGSAPNGSAPAEEGQADQLEPDDGNRTADRQTGPARDGDDGGGAGAAQTDDATGDERETETTEADTDGSAAGGETTGSSDESTGEPTAETTDGAPRSTEDGDDETLDASTDATADSEARVMAGPDGCEAGATTTLAALERETEYQLLTRSEETGSSIDDATVTVQGVVDRDGRRTCHAVADLAEPAGDGSVEIERMEIYAGDRAYAVIQFFDREGTKRFQVVREDDGTGMTMYDESGEEIAFPGDPFAHGGDGG